MLPCVCGGGGGGGGGWLKICNKNLVFLVLLSAYPTDQQEYSRFSIYSRIRFLHAVCVFLTDSSLMPIVLAVFPNRFLNTVLRFVQFQPNPTNLLYCTCIVTESYITNGPEKSQFPRIRKFINSWFVWNRAIFLLNLTNEISKE